MPVEEGMKVEGYTLQGRSVDKRERENSVGLVNISSVVYSVAANQTEAII